MEKKTFTEKINDQIDQKVQSKQEMLFSLHLNFIDSMYATKTMMLLNEYHKDNFINDETFKALFKQEAEKLATSMSYMILITGMDDILKDSLVQ